MNKYISDRDLGLNCDFVARGDDDVEVLDNAASHLKEYHEEDYERLKGQLGANIKEDEEDFEEIEDMVDM